MKTKYFKIIFLAAGIVAFTGCKKSWLDVNTNPNEPPVATSNYVFTNALNTTANNYWGDNSTGTRANELGAYYSGQWSQSSSYILSSPIFAYLYTNTDFNFWDDMYNNLEDYQYVINNAAKDQQAYLVGPSQVMQAMVFQNLVDLYGNVPYTDAFKGLNNLSPKFDDQKAVYESLIKLLDTAIVNIKANPYTVNKSSDIVFGGNATKWIKFANTLKLRILIRQARITGRDTYITTEINKAVLEGTGFLGAGEDVLSNPGYQASVSKQNPFYDRWGYDPTGATRSLGRFPRPTKFLFDLLIANNDTFRLKRIAYTISGENTNSPGVSKLAEIVTNYKGVPFGAGSGFTGPSTSSLGPSMIIKGQFNKSVVLMSAAESFLLQAEAKERYGASVNLPLTAKQYYDAGVTESFRLLGVPSYAAAATALLNSGLPDADYAASTDKLKTIAIQKWLALVNFNGLEAWSEYRKTGYPVTPQSLAVPDPLKRPLRLFYPSTEKGSNPNVPAQSSTAIFTDRLFWDVD
jgi:hypothetical protein